MVWSAVQSPMSKKLDTTRVPGFMVENLRAQLEIDSGSRNRVITVAFEKSVSNRSASTKVALVARRRPFGVPLGELDHVGVVLDARGAGAALGCGDDRAAVAGAEIDQEVAGHDLGHVEHLVDQRLRRRYPDHVLAGLTDPRLEFLRDRGTRHDRRPRVHDSASVREMIAMNP